MEKKAAMVSLSRPSSKISKGRDQRKRLGTISSRVIKALRPRVYIADASDFKRLVQELTGSCSNFPQQPTPDPIQPRDDVRTTTIVDSSDEVISSGSKTLSGDDLAGILELGEAASQHFTPLWHPQQVDDDEILMALGDIEGWLMDFDYAWTEVDVNGFATGHLRNSKGETS